MSLVARLPITLRAPLLVALLMVAVSVVVSERVMRRLVETQERQLVELSSVYLDGLSSSLTPHILREDIWEVYDALERSRALYSAVRPIETVVIDRMNRVIAASDPVRTPSMEVISPELQEPLQAVQFAISEAQGRAYVRRDVGYQGVRIGAIYAVLDIKHLLEERSDVVTTLLITNALLTLGFAAVGYAIVRRMVGPMRILASRLTLGAGERAEEIPQDEMPPSGSEARRLFDAYNRLVEAERQRGALAHDLAREEKLASLGRLASGMAHEINNPLGGLFNALHSIKRHGDRSEVRNSAADLIERGLIGIRDVVEATLETYRPDRSRRALTQDDLEDVRVLVFPEIKRKNLRLKWRNDIVQPVTAPGAPVRQVVLNLLLNACVAAPVGGRVGVEIEALDQHLSIVVEDDGQGLPSQAVKILETPDAPPPIGEGGLGLWMVRRLATELNGDIRCERRSPSGSRIELRLPIHQEPKTREAQHAIA